jgi:hypothetical protein
MVPKFNSSGHFYGSFGEVVEDQEEVLENFYCSTEAENTAQFDLFDKAVLELMHIDWEAR